LTEAEHAQIEPLHPSHAAYVFLGDKVDLRGHSHPPLNAWILAGLLAWLGDVREVPFHLAYAIFSIVAAMAMWPLARRFSKRPFLATLLFCAVPAFVINGNSLESDLPFLAFWMSAVAFFVYAVDRDSRWALAGSFLSAGLAALAAYQAVLLTPILAAYLMGKRRNWIPGWAAALAAPAVLGTWQIWERATSGALPASILAGYLTSYNFEALTNKARAVAALTVHLGWIVCPLIVLASAAAAVRDRRARWRLLPAVLAAAAGIFYDPNPLFWLSLGCGVWLLTWSFGKGFPGHWLLIFFAGAMAIFFTGSARYLLPLAAPAAILMADAVGPGVAAAGIALQLGLWGSLSIVNYQHWDAYRRFAATLKNDAAQHRVWINSDLGLRFYLESLGGLPLTKGQRIQPGDIVATSKLSNPIRVGSPLAPLAQIEVRPSIPLNLISLSGRSAYSDGSHGLLPFEISTAPIDRVRAEIAIEPQFSYVDPHDARAASQIVRGIFPDGWMTREAAVVLKAPEGAAALQVSFYVPQSAPARRVQMSVDGRIVAEKALPGPGAYTLTAPAASGARSITVTLSVDRTFSAPPDIRKLGVILTGIGFK
ncbi:MAG TPA: glycosyltransferase family 39 protein, partial [Bryobacteraceae bacterium]|nr:glycosyltransferase family 39 protein [Bryobacteraceae bacterium]